MTKHEFLQVLEDGLAKASPEERVAALQYYTEYLDEAGPEHEAEAIEQLGSPEKIVADILGASDSQTEGDWTPPNPPPPLGEALKTAGESLLHAGGDLFNRVKDEFTGEGAEEAKQPPESEPTVLPATSGSGHYNEKNNSIAKIIVIVLAAIFLLPLIGGAFGLIGGGIGVLGGLFVALIVLFLCPIILGVALLAAGISVIVMGAFLVVPSLGNGLFCIGIGVCLAGLGLMACYGGVKLVGGVLPRIFRSAIALIGKLVNMLSGLVGRIFHKGKQEDNHG